LSIVLLLRELQLGLRLCGRRRGLINGRPELDDIGLRVREPRPLFLDDIFVRLGIDPEKNFAGFEVLVSAPGADVENLNAACAVALEMSRVAAIYCRKRYSRCSSP
jgi:hypothetical protein